MGVLCSEQPQEGLPSHPRTAPSPRGDEGEEKARVKDDETSKQVCVL
jgi:hypothetical protein